MPLPVIGVTSSRFTLKTKTKAQGASQSYIDALLAAGACPVMIPLGLPEDALDKLLLHLDGLLFTGGGDVHPRRYNSLHHPLVNAIDEDRDRVELWLLQAAFARRLPFLGICRGLQLINVALGGTLYEDLLDQHAGAIQHNYAPGWPRDHRAHPVRVAPGSRLAQLLQATQVEVNSLHHQGIRGLARGLNAVAWSPDEVVEGFEVPDYPFGLAVQWHPECLPEDPGMQSLFRGFVQAAQPSG